MGRRMVFIAAHIEPVSTGGEQYNRHLIAAAERAGLEVLRVALSDSPVYRWLAGARGMWRLARPFAWLWLHLRLLRYRRETVLFDVWLAPLLWPGIELFPRHYLVMVHHLLGGMCDGANRRLWAGFCESRLLVRAARVLTVSESSRRQVERYTRGRVPVDIVNTAFEPVDGITAGGGEIVRILFVGHITRAKGVIDLARAAVELPRGIDWRLELVGRDSVEPDTRARIESICRSAGLGERVTLHGRLDDEALLAMYLSSDIFVLPSYWEGYGIVLLEAMSHRLAVVSTTAGAIPEVVADGETGLLVEPGDVAALGEAIARLMQDAGLRERLAANGLAFARAHADWEGMERQCVQWWGGV